MERERFSAKMWKLLKSRNFRTEKCNTEIEKGKSFPLSELQLEYTGFSFSRNGNIICHTGHIWATGEHIQLHPQTSNPIVVQAFR